MPLQIVFATIRKERLLLSRDLAGLALLLLMPAALIIVMALVQDAPFRDYQDLRFDLLLADEDGGVLATAVKNGLSTSKAFHVVEMPADGLRDALAKGRQHIGVVIPKGATAEVVNTANTIANSLAAQLGTGRLPQRAPRDSVYIRLYFDPVAKPAFRLAIATALDKYVTAASTNLLVSRIRLLAGGSDTSAHDDRPMQAMAQSIGIRETPLRPDDGKSAHINSVQHNVPAWTIFGMFFIIIPLAGHIIREREEGSALRVQLIAGAERQVSIGRILFYTAVCAVQAMVMACIGIWLLPLFGLPSLQLGQHPFLLFPVLFATALAATAYGYFLGSLFRSGTQALPFGAISIVMLSALGGIWVPVEVLPSALQSIAKASPLYWALEGAQNVILRNGGITDVLLPVAVLFAFAGVLWLMAGFWSRRAGRAF